MEKMSGPSNNSTNNTNNSNKFYKHQVSPNNSTINHDSSNNSSDRMVWEMRNNFRQYYRTPNLTPLLNSPILNEDIRIIDQYQKVTGDSINNSDINGLRVLDSSTEGTSNNYYSDKDIVIFDDIDDTRSSAWLSNSHFGNRLVTGFSPTSSHSSHSGNVSTGSDGLGTKNRIIGDIQIADLQGSPRRFGSTHSNETTDSLNMEKSEKMMQQKGALQSPLNFPKRAPGFPQRIISPIEPETSSSTTNNFASRQDDQKQLPVDPPFDYCYEFSETRKVLDEFFTPQEQQQFQQQKLLEFQQQSKLQQVEKALPLDDFVDFKQQTSATYIGQRLAALKQMQQKQHYEHQLQQQYENRSIIEEAITTKNKPILYENEIVGEDELDIQNYYGNCPQSKNFTLSPETTDYDYDSNCGDLDSEFSLKYISSDLSLSNEINGIQDTGRLYSSMPVLEDGLSSGHASDTENNNPNISNVLENDNMSLSMNQASQKYPCGISSIQASLYNYKNQQQDDTDDIELETSHDIDIDKSQDMQVAIKDIRGTLERSKKLTSSINEALIHSSGNTKNINNSNSVNNNVNTSKESLVSTNITQKQHGEEEEHDTDLETDRLLGQQRMNELQQGGFDDNKNMRKVRCANGQIIKSPIGMSKTQTSLRHGIGTQLSTEQSPDHSEECSDDLKSKSPTQLVKSPTGSIVSKGRRRNKEGTMLDPAVLIEGVLFRARYLGSTQLVCEGQPTKTTRMLQAEEAVSRIKAPEGETQPSTEVDLFISTEKIMVLNTDLKEIMMDHALKTISYIADIGDLVVLMARRRYVPQDNDSSGEPGSNETTPPNGGKNRTPKMICHVFESDEAQFIAQSIGQAFQVAYMEFLKANGIEDHSFMKEMDYQEVLNSQEIFGDELEIFAKKERQKEVVVPKVKGEILGVVIVESGWGSMLPTVVIANLAPNLPAARCGQLNIGDQIIAINGLSLVGLPLSQCQQYIKNTKNQTAVKFTVVPCAPVVEVKIKRPNTKYQLGFSVQNGVICSLLRGGIAERGGVRVGHRIIEINNQSVVAVPHEKIVNLLATSVGEISMKTMPTSMFRLLTGQENPIYI